MSKNLKDYFTKGFYPYPKQIEAIRFMLNHNYCILNGKPGVGKTIMSTAVMCLSGGKTVCVVPSFLKINWENEIGKYCNKKVKVFNKGRDFNDTDTNWDVAIISYNFISRADFLFKEARNVIFDEAHYLCSLEAIRTQSAHEVIEKYLPERVLLLSGTPVKSNVSQFYSLLGICSYNPKNNSGVDVSISYPTMWDFQDTFQYKIEFKVGRRKVTKFEGTRNIPELKRLLHNKMFTMTLDDVAEIPPLQEIEVMVSNMDIFKEEDLLMGTSEHVARRKKEAAIAKAQYTKEYVNDLLNSGGVNRVLVFSDHIDSANIIHKGVKESKYIDGSTPTDERVRIIDDLRKGKLSCVVSTILASNTGHTIVECKDMVVNDINWNHSENEQMVKRIYRIGQTGRVRIHYMLHGKMDAMLKKNVEKNKRNLKGVI